MIERTQTRILVLGAGYAGLAFVQGLRSARIPGLALTLVDRNPYHTLLTETHGVAAGTRRPALVEVPLSALGEGVTVVTAGVESIDRGARFVHTTAGVLPYDYLVFGLGGRDADFGIPGVRDHALFLRGLKDAEQIRTRLQQGQDGAPVVIVGGGLTGVELAAEIAMHRSRRIYLLEAAADLLPGLPPTLRQRARRRLGWLGVNVLTGTRVCQVSESSVALADGSVLATDLTVWAAGVLGHPLLTETGVTVDRAGRAVVDQHLRTTDEHIYVLGDSAACRPTPDAPPLPPSAQLAEQMGLYAAVDLAARLQGETAARKPFVPHLKGVLCDLGGLNAAGLVYRFQIHGFFGAVAKRATVLKHLWLTTGLKGFLNHLGEQVSRAGAGTRRGYARPD